MKTALFVLLGIVVVVLAGLAAWRQFDRRADAAEMARLLALQPADPPRFTASMVADLPEPARRFFTFAIAEGTPLHTVARIEMEGRFALGDKAAPNYVPMRATQVLAAPEGFVWTMAGASGAMRVSGSDTGDWTRFWLAGLVPVARAGGTGDHARSAFGRYVAEAIFWTPAALLPGPDVTWAPVSENVARVTMRRGTLEQAVDLTVGADGRPLEVVFQRWTNANADKVFRTQPFGGVLSEHRAFGGFRLPAHVEAGNHFGTSDYFPFFIADVTGLAFPEPGG